MPRLRNYRPADWDSFLALDLETGLAALRLASQDEKESFVARWPETLKTAWGWTDAGPTKDRSLLLVLEDDGEPGDPYAGHLWLREDVDASSPVRRTSGFSPSRSWREYRSRGWGRFLMERAVEEARARKLGQVGLSVGAENVVARKLYEEMGFEATRLSMFKRVR